MPFNTKNLKTDASGKMPVSQHFDTSIDDFDPVQGTDGASRVLLWDATGHTPLLTQSNPAYVKVTDGTNSQKVNADGSTNVTLSGSYVGYSSDTKPTTGVVAGNTYLELDTKDVYVYDGTQWVMY